MGMAGHDHIDARCDLIDPKRLQIVQDEDEPPAELDALGLGKFAGPIAVVHIATDSRDRCDSAEFRNDVMATDIAAVDDMVDARKATHSLRPQ